MIIITNFLETKTGLDLLDEHDDNFKKLQKQDEMAKEVNRLVGRYIDEPWADGKAFYVIVKENKKSVRIRVVTGIGDDWVIPYWGEETTIEKSYAIQRINYRDKMAELFGSREN